MRKKKHSASTARVPKRTSTRDGARRKRRSPKLILDLIVKAASGEFKRRGFAGATTAAIARKAGVTEAQLFFYFRSKSHLFRETVFKPLEQHFSDFIDKHVPHGAGPLLDRDMTDLYASELQNFIVEHMEMLTSLVVAQIYDSAPVQGVGKIDSLRTYFDRTSANMSARMKGRTAKVDPKLMVRVAFAAVLGAVMFKNWIFPPGIDAEEKIRAAINDFVMEGLGANFRQDQRSGF